MVSAVNWIGTLVIVVLTVRLSDGSAVSFCSRATAIPSLNVAQYGGLWYEYSRFFNSFEIGQSCANAIYTPNSDGTIGVLNRAKKQMTGQPVYISGSARQVSPPSGALLVTFQNVPSFSANANYLILATDYSSFSVVYSCSSLIANNLAWILTRYRSQSTYSDEPIQLRNDETSSNEEPSKSKENDEESRESYEQSRRQILRRIK